MKRISPTNDLAFKKVFGSDENLDILSGLMNDFFGLSGIEGLKIENPYNISVYQETFKNKVAPKLRYTINDIHATFNTGEFISELQMTKRLFFEERALYYAFKRYADNYNREDRIIYSADGKPIRYSSFLPLYSLNIIGYKHFNDIEPLRVLQLYDPIRHKRLTKEHVYIAFFELKSDWFETKNQEYWRDYLVTGEADPNAPDYIKKASGIIEQANLTKEELEMVDLMEKAYADEILDRHTAYMDGWDEGKADGKAEGKAEGAVERDMSIALIAFTNGLAQGGNLVAIENMLKEFNISGAIIQAARKQAESDRLGIS